MNTAMKQFLKFIILITIAYTSSAYADDATLPANTGDDPWSKTYVFHFEHDTFYVPAVWVGGDTHSTIPEINQLNMPPDGSNFKVKNYLIFGPMGTGMNIDRNLNFAGALTLQKLRLVAGIDFLVSDVMLHNNTAALPDLPPCSTIVWEIARAKRFYEDSVCSISCDFRDFGKEPSPTNGWGSTCMVSHRSHLGYAVEYRWDGFNVSPAKWEDQDRRLEQLLDWLKTPPSQRPKYLPDLPPKDKP